MENKALHYGRYDFNVQNKENRYDNEKTYIKLFLKTYKHIHSFIFTKIHC